MNEHARKRRDFIQNITIALLCVSAVLLFAKTQMYNLGVGSDGPLAFLSGRDLPAAAPPAAAKTALTGPVRAAVASAYGRYGSVTLTTGDEAFEPLRGLLEQALRPPLDYSLSSRQEFFAALDRTSVYYDFLSPLPLSVVADLVRAEGEDTVSARRLVVAEEDSETVSLYLWDGGDGVFRCATALTPETLEETVSRYELGNAFFAFESPDPNAGAAEPASLFLETPPALPELSITIPLSDTDRLLLALDFNPNTQFRYVDAGGTEVVREGERTLRIHTDGTITYQGGGAPALPIIPSGESPTLLETAGAVNDLLHSLLGATVDDAELYLEEIRQSGGSTVVRFGYQVGGVPIRFTDGESAAQVTVTDGAVSAMTFRIRQYTAGGNASLLLPLRQALAIAAREEGAELAVGYADGGAGTVSAKWLAE